MSRSVFLRNDRIELRPVETEDAEFLARLVNDPEVRAGLGSAMPVSLHDEREWIEEHDGTHLLVVAENDPVGVLGFEERDPPWGVAELGYFLATGAWGNGYATAAVSLLAGYAYRERRFDKLVAGVYETNPASARVLEKVGFTHEATLRKEAFVNGERIDIERYGLLADEYEPPAGE